MKEKFSMMFEKILTMLRARTPIGGLEVSDAAVRAAMFDGTKWSVAAVPLAPGTMQGNQILNEAAFAEALQQLRRELLKSSSHRPLNVVLSLSSVSVYSQVFTLPAIDEDGLEKAIQLNLRMIAPSDINQLYSGWQALTATTGVDTVEVFSAFLNREISNRIQAALHQAGFVTVALEYKALSLVRVLRHWGVAFDAHEACVVINIDTAGIDFLVVRSGNLYFEYFISWAQIQGSERQISPAIFQSSLVRSLHQVINFAGQHWPDPLKEVIISAPNIYPTVEKIVKDNFAVPVRELKLKLDPPLASSWYVALGSATRGLVARGNDTEISLLGVGARDEFLNTQLLQFVDFWKFAIPTALIVLAGVFVGASIFLGSVEKGVQMAAADSSQSGQLQELTQYESQASNFNQTIAMIKNAESISSPKILLIEKLQSLASANQVSLDTIDFVGFGQPSTITGEATSSDQILAFKTALEGDAQFSAVTLPINQAAPSANGTSFSLTLVIAAPAAPKT